MLTAQDNATVVRAHFEAFNRRDHDKTRALMTDDVKWMNIPFNVNHVGHKGYREFIDNWTMAMADFTTEIVNVVAGDEWTAVEFIGRGTHTGPFEGPQGAIPTTKKRVELKFCQLMRVQDGQIAEAHLYFDAATLWRQFDLPQQMSAASQPVSTRN